MLVGMVCEVVSGYIGNMVIYVGRPKKKVFSLKKIYLHFEQKHLIPFKMLSIGGSTLVQSFFPLCEASLELLKHDVVECLLRSCFHLLHGALFMLQKNERWRKYLPLLP
jgi:hypothetical protein